jgi:ankyrin repeat protein
MNFQKIIARICLIAVTLLSMACNQGKTMNKIDYSKYFSNPTEIELIKAVMKGDSATIKRLAASGVNLNAVGKYETTPLSTALKCRQKEIVSLLLQLGVDPNFTTPGKAVPAFTATELDDSSYLNILLEHGLNPNLKEDGEPIIFSAIRMGYQWSNNSPSQWSNYDLLISKGADINIKSGYNTTLVLELVGLSRYDLAKTLILQGADYTTPNNAGLTVLEVLIDDQKAFGADPNHAAFKKRKELLNMLRERGVKVPDGF